MDKAKIGVIIHKSRWPGVLAEEDFRRLKKLGRVIATRQADPLTDDQAIAILKDCDVAIGSWGTPKPSEAIMAACPKLKLWVHAAGTVKGHFGPHMKGRSMKIATCKGAIADNVAQAAIAEVVLGLRRILPSAIANRKGGFPRPANVLAMHDATVGVIAASDVGRRAIELLQANHCGTILLYDPFVTARQAAALGARKVADLVDLCRRSHAVTLHAPAIPACAKMLKARHFRAMPDDCVFVNTARGMCIDEQALIAELRKGRLFAFLDVSDPEPAAARSPLRTLANVVYSCHISGGPGTNVGKQAVDDVAAFLSGGQPTCVVTEDMLDRLA
jgi:phosphoglycerate dehydrogenase-like enzyme